MSENKPQLMSKPLVLAICVPGYGGMNSKWVNNFINLTEYCNRRYITKVCMREINPVDECRNMLIDDALMYKPDYILCVDSDNIIPKNTVDLLIKTMEEKNAEFVTAVYFQKAKPHYPVLRNYRNGRFWKIENLDLGQIIEVGGCGMGTCLIKPSLFDKIEKPYFSFNRETWGLKEVQIAEDLSFCKKLFEKGIKMYCNTAIVSTHLGGAIEPTNYFSFTDIRKMLYDERQELITDIASYTDKKFVDVELELPDGRELINREWNKLNPQTDDDVKKFYKETKNYVCDLAFWHFEERRQFDEEVVLEMLYKFKAKKVLDFGAGIGQNSYMLAKHGIDVTLADLDSYTLNFAEHRFKSHNVPCKIWRTDTEEPPKEKYDVILCFDVFEHMPMKELQDTVEKLIKLKHKNTKIRISVPFGKSVNYPMHFDIDQGRQVTIARLINDFPKDEEGDKNASTN